MTSTLQLELRLLVLRHGRQPVIAALASLDGVSVEDIERDLAALAARRQGRVKGAKRAPAKSARAQAEELVEKHPRLRRIVSLYESKMFLPSLRDVRAFLTAHGLSSSVKSRDAAYGKVVGVLAGVPEAELQQLENSQASGKDRSAYSSLAKELMNPSDRGR